MRRNLYSIVGTFTLVLFLSSIAISEGQTYICASDLPSKIDSVLSASALASSRWGIKVCRKDGPGNFTTLYERNADQLITPASNTKLLTASAAALKYSTSYTFETKYISKQEGSSNVVCVIGGGDLTLTTYKIQINAQKLKPLGTIDKLYIDGSDFMSEHIFSDSVQFEDATSNYGQPGSAFPIDSNIIALYVQPSAVGKAPTITFANSVFAQAYPYTNLATTVEGSVRSISVEYLPGYRGVVISGTIGVSASSYSTTLGLFPTDQVFGKLTALYSQTTVNNILYEKCPFKSGDAGVTVISTLASSSTMREVLNQLLSQSDNWYADSMLKKMGADARFKSGDAIKDGLGEIRNYMINTLGVDPDSFKQADGSGLSYANYVAPEALIQVLMAMDQQPVGADFVTWLPQPGQSGTLQNRLLNAPAKIYAKTGTLTATTGLSGWAKSGVYQDIVFSIIVNNANLPLTQLRDYTDTIATYIASIRATC